MMGCWVGFIVIKLYEGEKKDAMSNKNIIAFSIAESRLLHGRPDRNTYHNGDAPCPGTILLFITVPIIHVLKNIPTINRFSCSLLSNNGDDDCSGE